MQIIIDIPENVIEDAKSSPNYYPTYHFEKIWRAIANGTPLPKGHGDLVDYEELKSNASECSAYAEVILSHAKPKIIIEADKEQEG